MKNSISGLGTVALCLAASTALAESSVTTGYKNAEALAVDSKGEFVYISVPGELGGKDGDGFIARMPVGGGTPEVWLDGLNGPKGSQIVGDTLYVVDATDVLVIDLATKSIDTIAMPEGGFILDLAVNADGDVFVTDTPLNTIYKISDGDVTVFAQNDDYGFPNGIEATNDGGFVLATWGLISDFNTWETSELGRFVHIDGEGAVVGKSDPMANFDGVEMQGDRFVATGFNDGGLYSFDPATLSAEKTATMKDGLADVAFSGGKTFTINYNTSVLAIN